MNLQENTMYALHYVTYPGTTFQVATSNGLGGDTLIRNVTDGRTHARTYGRRTDIESDIRPAGLLLKRRANWVDHQACSLSQAIH